jgi:nitroimidazol reductase NimA-like FMN-containing flavoprotein (pyridoxamine 5'-phosphate oxidase superfamily)
MSGPDEPVLDGSSPATTPEDLGARILDLVQGEPFAVLATQGDAQPYGSVIAIAFTPDLRHALFATPVTTRKYRLLEGSQRVAIVVDDRPRWPDDLMRVQAVTVTGRAVRIERDEDYDRWAGVLVRRHPYLETFVRAESCALFRVDVVRYIHVERFQEVREWTPPSS